MKLKEFKKGLCVILTVMMLVMLCPINVSAASFKLNKSSVTVTKGYSTTLKVTGTTKKASWSSSNKKVATVSSSGKVYGKKAGSCYITAKIGKESVKCKVNVVNGKLTLSQSTLNLEEGDSETVTVTAIGSHSLKIVHSNKSVAKAGWTGGWDGNDHDINISALKEGTATVKIVMSKYTSIYKTIKVNVSAAEQEIDDTDDENTDKTSTIKTDRTALYLSKGETATLNVYSDNTAKTTVKSSDTSVVTVSEPKWGANNIASITVTAVKGGNANIYVEASDNAGIRKSVAVTVMSDGYYEISDIVPSKRISSDTVLKWTEGNLTKYMLAPYGYDIAHTNSIFAKSFGKAQYYLIYEESPAKLASTDTVSSFRVTRDGKSVSRYVLLPASYDAVRYNTLTAVYTGKYNYWTIYNEKPANLASGDTVKSWQASVGGVLYTRYVLLPTGYSQSQLEAIMNEDIGRNNTYYSVSLTEPAKRAADDTIYTFGANGRTAYMLLPKGYDVAQRDTSIAKYTGVYNYYTIYTEKPVVTMSTDIIKDWRKVVNGKYAVRYMLLPAGTSDEFFNSLIRDDVNSGDVYYVIKRDIPSKLQSGDTVYSWYNAKEKTTKYMLLPESYDVLKKNNLVYTDTGVYEYYTAYSDRPYANEAAGEQILSVRTNKGTVYILVPADYDNDRVNAAVNEVNRS